MPRVGDVFQLLSGTLAVPNTTIQSAPYNAQQQDWVLEANTPRPISAGGTGATTAAAARVNLGAIGAGDLAAAATKTPVVDTDSIVIIDSAAANANKRWLVSDFRASLATMTNTNFTLVSTDGSSGGGPTLTLDRQSPTPAGAPTYDYLGYVNWLGRNSAAESHIYADILVQISDHINNQESASLQFRTSVAGGLPAGITLSATGVQIHRPLFAESTSSFTGAATFTGAANFNGGADFQNSIVLNRTAEDVTGPSFLLQHTSTTPAIGDNAGVIYFKANNSALTPTDYGYIQVNSTNVTNLSENGAMYFVTMRAGTLATSLTLDSTFAAIYTPLTVTGNITSTSNVIANGGVFIGSSTQAILGTPNATNGPIYLRPNGYASGTNQTSIDTSGNMSVGGNITAASGDMFAQDTTFTGRMTSSQATVVGTLDAAVVDAPNFNGGSFNGGTFHASGGSNGFTNDTSTFVRRSSIASASSFAHLTFHNTNGTVGSINTSGSGTVYNTSSDENLKDFIGPYDPLEAIRIIRADPVRDFTWKSSGDYAVGWGAQTSYAISPDLACPPDEWTPENREAMGLADDVEQPGPGETGYHPWGVDQGKRTPYLWAALTWALDRIDELHARIKTLEEATA